MNTKLTILSLATVFAVGGFILAANQVSAYRGDPKVLGPNYTPERHAAMTKAFESKDYEAWKNLMQGRGRVTQVVTKDNFAKFAQMHQLMLAGKTDEANQIRAELGLGQGGGQGMGKGRNR